MLVALILSHHFSHPSFSLATSSKTTYIAVLPLSNDIRVSSAFNFILNNNPDFTLKASTSTDSDHHLGSNRLTLQSKSQKINYTFFTPGLSEFAFDPLAIASAVSTCHSVMLLIDLSEDMAHPLIDDVSSVELSSQSCLF